MGKVKSGGQTYKGTLVSNYQAKRALEFNSTISSDGEVGFCSWNSTCIKSQVVPVNNPLIINCNGTSYSIYYNTTNSAQATSFCAYDNTTNLPYTGTFPESCMQQIYPIGSICYQYM
jgi:hypothetical protein